MTRVSTTSPPQAPGTERVRHASAGGTVEHWSARAYAACSTVAWCCGLNALWIVFTLAGGVVLGIGPATVAACVLSRRRMRGESVHLRDFAATWRREMFRGGLVVLPVPVAIALLATNYAYFSALGPGATVPRLATLGALLLAVGAGSYVGPMYAHYDLPRRRYLVKAMRFALARPASTLLLLFVGAAVGSASAAVPVLLLTVSIGAWLQTSTWLCVRFFTENEDRLADAARPDPTRTPVRALPTEPLRMR